MALQDRGVQMMNTGSIAMIYHSPITQELPEGKARLVEEHRPDVGDGVSMWWVEFVDEPGVEYLRTVTESV